MGRALLLFLAGAGVVFGVLLGQMRDQNLRDAQLSSRYYERVLAREIALTGLGHGLRRLLEDWNARTPIEERPYQGGRYTVRFCEIEPAVVRLYAVGRYGGTWDTAGVLVRRSGSPIPTLPAAITLVSAFSDEISPDFRGNAFRIDGRDHGLDGRPRSGSSAAYGILATRAAIQDRIIRALNHQQRDNIQGRNDLVPNVVFEGAGFDAAALIEQLWQAEALSLPSRLSGAQEIGTLERPVLARAPNGLELSGAVSGVGILLVDGHLRLSGNVRWRGMVIVRNGEDLTVMETVSGTPQLIGALLVYNTASRPIAFRINGNPSLLYSSEALALLRQRLFFGPTGIEVANWLR
ncbi:MAG: hypothetical protein RML47_01680 [Bacteroidota bacterium]|nr:hypothetical protein [Rhodothermia bacterium]MCS7155216.1 hypothetical protein [Bacteroidota bacterium]MDW8138620.1 hypothetical protein [Bacteroidota bacterium]MDW8284794.1 hypothetical protein [Bacteroidota bacterium]